jgi:ABC-type transport system involved in cytochrome c biogenesis permease component
VRPAFLLAGKDLRIEMRGMKRLSVLLLFSFVLVLVGSFAYRGQGDDVAHLPPLLWLALVFTQLFFLSETYRPEMENHCFDALCISPAKGYQLLFGKLLSSTAIVLAISVAILLEITFFASTLALLRLEILVLIVLETIGLLSLGNLFFARMAAGDTQGFELYPLVIVLSIPLVFIAVEASRLVLSDASGGTKAPFYLLLILYDVLLLVTSAVTYRAMIGD